MLPLAYVRLWGGTRERTFRTADRAESEQILVRQALADRWRTAAGEQHCGNFAHTHHIKLQYLTSKMKLAIGSLLVAGVAAFAPTTKATQTWR